MGAYDGPLSGQTGCFVKAGLAEGTNDATIKTAAPNGVGIDFGINGIAYNVLDSATDNTALTAHPIQPVLTSCFYLVQIDSSNVFSTKKGNTVITAGLGVVGGTLQWPLPDADKCPLGGYDISLLLAATYTNGTTDMSASDITATFYDFLGGIPLAPRSS